MSSKSKSGVNYHGTSDHDKPVLQRVFEPPAEALKKDWMYQRRIALIGTQHMIDRSRILATKMTATEKLREAKRTVKETKVGLHLNPWAALLGEERGELARINAWQHVPIRNGKPCQPALDINDPQRYTF